MIKRSEYRVLVVDDEPAMQRLLMRALSEKGFQCDSAADGQEAEEQVAQTRYDAVVTDLRMPNKHGHALATHLLSLSEPPVIVIHTGLLEPKLAKDLLARGVDDIVFKPFDFGILAAKVRALVERRFVSHRPEASLHPVEKNSPPVAQVPLAVLERKLSALSQILPISTAALDVFNLTNSDEAETPQLVAAIQRDAAFAAKVLRIANSAFYNSSGQPIVELERAVVRIGQKRIGELALAMNALASLTPDVVPWLDLGLSWKRSMAAGLAAEMLIQDGAHHKVEGGLMLSAIMHPLGRVVLGSLFPMHYEKLTQQSREESTSLQQLERKIFPLTHAEVLAHVLAQWNLPPNVQRPLKLILEDYATIAQAPEPTRTKAELVKLAIFVAYLAVEEWEEWDLVEVPSASLLNRLGLAACLTKTIAHAREGVEWLASLQTGPSGEGRVKRAGPAAQELAYCDLSDYPFDLFESLLPSMGIRPILNSEGDMADSEAAILVNCLGVAPDRLATIAARASPKRLLIVSDAEHGSGYGECGRTVVLPCSYSRLRAACQDAAGRGCHTRN